MKTFDGKLSSSSGSLQTKTSSAFGSHAMTLVQIPLEEISRISKAKERGTNLFEYHLTAEIPNSQLSRRELSLLLEVLEYQIVHFGVNLNMLLGLYTLYSKLIGNKREASEINDAKIRTVCTVAEILLKCLKDFEFSLYNGEFIEIPLAYRDLLGPYLMRKRTYGSRYRTWRPEKFIRIRAVPVSTLFERSPNSNAERYSGYTKGYGESHSNAHRQKTKPSAELDGDPETISSDERNLIFRVSDPDHQIANSLWIKFKAMLGINR